jgi:hypothetical protein
LLKGFLRSVLPRSTRAHLRKLEERFQIGLRESLEFAGYTVARTDNCSSPLPATTQLRASLARWSRPSTFRGIEYDVEQLKRDLLNLLSGYLNEFSTLPSYAELHRLGFGPGYAPVDALVLYGTIRQLKPKRYLEVGSGLSTYYCSLAAERNEKEGCPLEITCIEPFPYDKLRSFPRIRLVEKEVQEVDLSVFQQLQENDILFIDSSHVLRIDGDVPFLYLEALPHLNIGVVIHIHDAHFPYNTPYPPEYWIFGRHWPMFWNEAMVLQAFLCYNSQFKLTMSTPLIRHFDEAFLRNYIPCYDELEQNPGKSSSLWLRRVAGN